MRYIQSHTGSSLEKVLAGLELAGPPERGPADNNFSKNGIFLYLFHNTERKTESDFFNQFHHRSSKTKLVVSDTFARADSKTLITQSLTTFPESFATRKCIEPSYDTPLEYEGLIGVVNKNPQMNKTIDQRIGSYSNWIHPFKNLEFCYGFLIQPIL